MIYVRSWNPENCPIIPLFLILCDNFMAIFAKLYFSFSEAPINRMEKLSVVQNATKSMSWFLFFFFFFTTLMTILFLGGKKKKNTNICLTLFSVPSLPTALVSEFPEVFLIHLFLMLETTLKASLLFSYCFGCWHKIIINSWQNGYAIFTIIF